AVGEAAGGGADVGARKAGERDGPVGEGVLEFEAATADVFEVRAEETDGGGGGDGGAGLVDALLVDEDAAGEDESLGAFAGGGVAVVHEELVETYFLGSLFCGIDHFSARSHGEPGSIFSWLRTMVANREHRRKE